MDHNNNECLMVFILTHGDYEELLNQAVELKDTIAIDDECDMIDLDFGHNLHASKHFRLFCSSFNYPWPCVI